MRKVFFASVLVTLALCAPRETFPEAKRNSSLSRSSSSSSLPNHQCQLTIVDGFLRDTEARLGQYLAGHRNCTDFRKAFDQFCVQSFGRERCKSVSVWCPNGSGHALNFVELEDNTWYLVDPQGEIYNKHPLDKPEIPDDLLAEVMPGCGCTYDVHSYAGVPNTDPYRCAGDDLDLWGVHNSLRDRSPIESCLKCCAALPPPPNHPNEQYFYEVCRNSCEVSGLDLPREGYCSFRYAGEACKACCSASSEGVDACKASCSKDVKCVGLDPNWGTVPEASPNECATKTLNNGGDCASCCQGESTLCNYLNSMPCAGWRRECLQACASRAPVRPEATRTAKPGVSPIPS